MLRWCRRRRRMVALERAERLLDFPELAAYPDVRGMFNDAARLIMSDVRAMLQLDLDPPLGSGCNFSAALALCNVLVGIAERVLTRSGHGTKCSTCGHHTPAWGTRTRFMVLVVKHFPWPPGILDDEKARLSNVLYSFVRNPLTHNLGIAGEGEPDPALRKRALTLAQIEALETSTEALSPPPITHNGDSYEVHVPLFYAAVLRTLRSFASNADEMTAAQARLQGKRERAEKRAAHR